MLSPCISTLHFVACCRTRFAVVVRVHRAARGSRLSRSTRLPDVRAAQDSHQNSHLLRFRKYQRPTLASEAARFSREAGSNCNKSRNTMFCPHSTVRYFYMFWPITLILRSHHLPNSLTIRCALHPRRLWNKHRNFKAHKALQVTLTVSSANKPARDIVVVSNLRTLRFTLYELVTANVTLSGIIVFLLLAGTQVHHRSIWLKNR